MYDDSLVILGLLIIALMNTCGPILWLRQIKEWGPHTDGRIPTWFLITLGTFIIASGIAAVFFGYAFALSLIF